MPRRGYRFVAPAQIAAEPGRRRLSGAAVLGIGLVVAGGWWALRGPGAPAGDRAPPRRAAQVREHLLVGKHQADRRSRDGLEKSIAAFQSAAALDPESAEAYSRLASSYALLGIYDYWRPRESFAPAETMARRALELDPDSAEAHLAIALVAAVGHWDWQAALASCDRALELAPESTDVLLWRGRLLTAFGRHDEAVASLRHALQLDPTSPVLNAALAWDLFLARRGDEAVAQSRHTIELHPDYYDAWDDLKWIELTLGHEAPGLEAWIRSEELDHGRGDDVLREYEAAGIEGLHRASIRSQVAKWESGEYRAPFDIVLEYAALGELEEAMEWLERSFAERETDLVGLAVDPRLDVLREDGRFRELVESMGFPSAR